jgi:hypothetical protein
MICSPDSACAPNARVAQDALKRCASGDIPPELALEQLLDQSPSDEATEAVLGTAIWEALERREPIRAERLAQVQRLWNRQRRTVHSSIWSL